MPRRLTNCRGSRLIVPRCPGLVLHGSPGEIALAIPTAVAGSIFLAAGLMGYLFKPATWWERAFLLGAAVLLIDPGFDTDLLGLGRFAAATVSQCLRKNVAVGSRAARHRRAAEPDTVGAAPR